MNFRNIVGWMMLVAGISVFAIRLQHTGPYALPQQGNLLAGVLAFLIGAVLATPWLGEGSLATWSARLALSSAPIVLFFALYATLAEVEEVVILRAPEARGQVQDLRLWVVDRTHHQRTEKYAVQRIAMRLGIFGRDAAPDVVTLSLTPCPATGSDAANGDS